MSGVDFEPFFAEKEMVEMEGIMIPVISLSRLRQMPDNRGYKYEGLPL